MNILSNEMYMIFNQMTASHLKHMFSQANQVSCYKQLSGRCLLEKMAAKTEERFASLNSGDLEVILTEKDSKNTKRSTETTVDFYRLYLGGKKKEPQGSARVLNHVEQGYNRKNVYVWLIHTQKNNWSILKILYSLCQWMKYLPVSIYQCQCTCMHK